MIKLAHFWAGRDIAPLDRPLYSMAEMHAWVEYQVRICQRLRVKFPGPTRQSRHLGSRAATWAHPR
jgi:hypothetical protein